MTRAWLEQVPLPPASRQALAVALDQIDHLDAELAPIDQWLRTLARRQPGCQALMTHYGIGAITAPTILAELGDVRRFAGGDQVVWATGLIRHHRLCLRWQAQPGHLSRQGPQVLRWALFEAAKAAARPSSPDYAYYRQVKARQAATGPPWRWPASSPAGCATPCGRLGDAASSRSRGSR